MTHRHLMPVAVHVFLVRDGRLLLLLRQNTGYEDGSYSVIAGHVERGERIFDAVVREAREEVGIALDEADLHMAGVMHRRVDDSERIDFFVTARWWLGEVSNAEPSKCGDLRWCPSDLLPANIVPYVRRAIERGLDGPWFDAYGWEARP